FSPNGQWIVYETASAVYVEPFPPTGALYQESRPNSRLHPSGDNARPAPRLRRSTHGIGGVQPAPVDAPPIGPLTVQRKHDAGRHADWRKALDIVEDVADVHLGANADGAARYSLEVQAATALDREVVDVADAAVIETEHELGERQHGRTGIREAEAQTAHVGRHRSSVKAVEANLAHDADERHVALDGAREVEVRARRARLSRLVVDEVVVRARGGEVRIGRLSRRRGCGEHQHYGSSEQV